ncbi:hypothetical protein JMJ77_0001810 [Colletotrichum scovillei]|uniref:Uncharacterized protein n=1 Tax=Colletotrichum scovillei TaxID=1209932 RepID=A0A9P7UCP3_9PEZI|nr:hypothetical protein JMJ77_0001810 [Colletotrichum scovillei]KAG7070220.1 hypothetical protein JMJ76_0001476 [Colletotrichum scovillei]KAG7078469.1 hypothetical protein JMJ78_0002140 [Colletotrichum scovillei]
MATLCDTPSTKNIVLTGQISPNNTRPDNLKAQDPPSTEYTLPSSLTRPRRQRTEYWNLR